MQESASTGTVSSLGSLGSSGPLGSLGMVGLGRMGANIARRAARHGQNVVGFDPRPEVVAELESEGLIPALSLAEMVAKLPTPRTIWVMVPAGQPTQSVIDELSGMLAEGDCVIDGGNSYYRDDIEHSKLLGAKGIEFIDVGTDRKSTRLNSSHIQKSRMPSSA